MVRAAQTDGECWSICTLPTLRIFLFGPNDLCEITPNILYNETDGTVGFLVVFI